MLKLKTQERSFLYATTTTFTAFTIVAAAAAFTIMRFPRLSEFGLKDYATPPPTTTGKVSKARHPLSDPQETFRKTETQCQHCYKSKAEGVILSKCTGCKSEIYCVRAFKLVSVEYPSNLRLMTPYRAKSARELLGPITARCVGASRLISSAGHRKT